MLQIPCSSLIRFLSFCSVQMGIHCVLDASLGSTTGAPLAGMNLETSGALLWRKWLHLSSFHVNIRVLGALEYIHITASSSMNLSVFTDHITAPMPVQNAQSLVIFLI